MRFLNTEREHAPSRQLLERPGCRDMGYIPHIETQVYGRWTKPETEAEIAGAREKLKIP